MSGERYFRVLVQTGTARPRTAVSLAGGNLWFTHAECLSRDAAPRIVPANKIPEDVLANLTSERAAICGLKMNQPRLMGVLNATPDSFSDGGRFDRVQMACAGAEQMIAERTDILDIGGESTRPGADTIDPFREIRRVVPVIKHLKSTGQRIAISIDTRKAPVASAALRAGVRLVNDVSALTYDPQMAALVSQTGAAVCLMHASGDPKTMQENPVYENVLLDVYDYLRDRIAYSESQGIARSRIIVDPGIGFGKTRDHNLTLIRGLSLFHALGCVVLLGVSRKRFIGTIGGEPVAQARAPGSIAIGLEALRQGVQILRVHDIRETKQALALWQASR